MKPVMTVEQIVESDRITQKEVDVNELIRRAGTFLYSVCAKLFDFNLYGKRVVVLTGKGNNGKDGLYAAEKLVKRGATVSCVEPTTKNIKDCDLVIDAAFGTGFHGEYEAPKVEGRAKVVACDIVSGLDGNTGVAKGCPLKADITVTFGAYKLGHFINDGKVLSGSLELSSIGLKLVAPELNLVELEDVEFPKRHANDHKWKHSVLVFAGSKGMYGARDLVLLGAYSSGASIAAYVTSEINGNDSGIIEAIRLDPDTGLEVLNRKFKCAVLGPGIGKTETAKEKIGSLLSLEMPLVIDADALNCISEETGLVSKLVNRSSPTILTPHEQEFKRIADKAGVQSDLIYDRVNSVIALSQKVNAIVLLKGPSSVAVDPSGKKYLIGNGGSSLAVAGSGDVLAGFVGGFLSYGIEPIKAIYSAAFLHAELSKKLTTNRSSDLAKYMTLELNSRKGA